MADSLYKSVTKKFSFQPKVWINYLEFLMKAGRREAARAMMERSFKSLQKAQRKLSLSISFIAPLTHTHTHACTHTHTHTHTQTHAHRPPPPHMQHSDVALLSCTQCEDAWHSLSLPTSSSTLVCMQMWKLL